MEDVDSNEIVVLLLETDDRIDEDEDDILGVADVNDVPGELEIHYVSIQHLN